MRRSGNMPERPSSLGELFREGLVLSGGALMRSPVLVGSVTAFAVTMSYVAANALWYQPHFHSGAFFETRVLIERAPAEAPAAEEPRTRQVPIAGTPRVDAQPMPDADRAGETSRSVTDILEQEERTVELPRPEMPGVSLPAPQPRPSSAAAPSPVSTGNKVTEVQRILSELNLYSGDIDGLAGSMTEAAVRRYRSLVGLGESGAIDAALLSQLGIAAEPASVADSAGDHVNTASIQNAPVPALRATQQEQAPTRAPETVAPPAAPQEPAASRENGDGADARIVRIQAGLRAFGNEGIELDGRVGERTRVALLEFQSLFGLDETGEADTATFDKMREIGLTN